MRERREGPAWPVDETQDAGRRTGVRSGWAKAPAQGMDPAGRGPSPATSQTHRGTHTAPSCPMEADVSPSGGLVPPWAPHGPVRPSWGRA